MWLVVVVPLLFSCNDARHTLYSKTKAEWPGGTDFFKLLFLNVRVE